MELVVLKGLPWHNCMVYLDDILIYSKSFEDHLSALGEVFTWIGAAGFRLNTRNCPLTQNHVVFLGHVISAEGLRPDPRNTEKVTDASKMAVGALLAQDTDGLEKVVAYASHSLTAAKR